MKRPIWGALLFALVVAVAGCNKSGQNEATANKAVADASQPAGAAPAGQEEAAPSCRRTLPSGLRWRVAGCFSFISG